MNDILFFCWIALLLVGLPILAFVFVRRWGHDRALFRWTLCVIVLMDITLLTMDTSGPFASAVKHESLLSHRAFLALFLTLAVLGPLISWRIAHNPRVIQWVLSLESKTAHWKKT